MLNIEYWVFWKTKLLIKLPFIKGEGGLSLMKFP